MGVANRIDPRKLNFCKIFVEDQSVKYLRLENIALYGKITNYNLQITCTFR